jgi:hypothetical protein
MEYFVTRNLSHNGVTYTTGQKLEMSETTATSLLETGVLSFDAPTETSPSEVIDEQQAQPVVGGITNQSGEPSIDTTETPVDGDVKDITPNASVEPVENAAPETVQDAAPDSEVQPKTEEDKDFSADL